MSTAQPNTHLNADHEAHQDARTGPDADTRKGGSTVADIEAAVPVRGARVVPVPPPLYYAAAFAVGLLLHRSGMPLSLGARPATAVVGAVALVAGIGLAAAGVVTVAGHHTTIVPHAPVTRLVRTGPYRWTRNPMYTGLAIGYLGAAAIAGTWWPILTLPAALVAIRWLVIAPEERYLTARYGPDYTDYLTHVRRWL